MTKEKVFKIPYAGTFGCEQAGDDIGKWLNQIEADEEVMIIVKVIKSDEEQND